MSLICIEVGRDIEFGEPLHAGTRCDVNFFSALAPKVIARVAEHERRLEPCATGRGGVDIHEATSSKNFNGSYTITDFKLGRFLFSVDQAVAERCFPSLLSTLPPFTVVGAITAMAEDAEGEKVSLVARAGLARGDEPDEA